MIDFLNFQPFGDHGVMSLLSIRMIHIIMIVCAYYIVKATIKANKQEKSTKYYNNPNSARNIHLRTRKDKSRGNHYGID